MKTLTAGLEAHLALSVTTLATCWKVTRADATIFGFTDHPDNLVVAGVTYAAATGYSSTTIDTNSTLSVDNLEVSGFLDSASITEADLIAGKWDYAAVEIFQVNYADLTHGTLRLRRGRLGEVRISYSPKQFAAELRGLAQALQQSVGKVYQAACRADLGDAECGVNLVPLTLLGRVVTAVTDRRTFAASALADGLWTAGKVTFTTGLNTGFSMEVKTWTNGTKSLVLSLPLPYVIAISDEFTIQPGCLKRIIEDCKTGYNNVVNHRGEPYVPGVDALMRGPG